MSAEDEDVGVNERVDEREKLIRRGEAFVDIDSDLRVRMRRAFVDTLPGAMDDQADKVVARFRSSAGDFLYEIDRVLLDK